MFETIASFYLDNQRIISIASIPFISGFIGWFTNMVALKMTFYPLHFKGIKSPGNLPNVIGWQGIIPRKAAKMAGISVDIITTQLIPVEEIYSRLDPAAMAKELRPAYGQIADEIVNEVGKSVNREMWSITPQLIKDEINRRVHSEAPKLVSGVLADLRANIHRIFDVKGIVVQNLTGRNVKNMVEMFQRVGVREFKFIELSGLYFGFLFGIVQMGLFLILSEGWTLPVAGVIVGYATNWLALKMIFRPQQPRRFGPVEYQGLFHKRQEPVSKEYARLVATKILSARQITNHMMFGPTAEIFYEILTKNIAKAVDHMSEWWKPAAVIAVGEKKYLGIRDNIVDRLRHSVPNQARAAEEYIDRTLDLNNTIYSRLRSLPSAEFERILRSAFQEDELLLILVGAALGAMAGLGQWLLFFS